MNTPSQLEFERNLLAHERTQLAVERTFLAWLRTGLTSVGIGIAIARLIIFENVHHEYLANIVGQLLVLWGVAIFIFALVSYQRTNRKLNQTFPYTSSYIGLAIATLVLIILSLVLFWIIA